MSLELRYTGTPEELAAVLAALERRRQGEIAALDRYILEGTLELAGPEWEAYAAACERALIEGDSAIEGEPVGLLGKIPK